MGFTPPHEGDADIGRRCGDRAPVTVSLAITTNRTLTSSAESASAGTTVPITPTRTQATAPPSRSQLTDPATRRRKSTGPSRQTAGPAATIATSAEGNTSVGEA